MMCSVALLTPALGRDLERFEWLCESIDKHVRGHSRHYVIVDDRELKLFAKFASDHRVIWPSSNFLPRWLLRTPSARNAKRRWLSLRSRPVDEWRIQQILKIAGALAVEEDRVCVVDADNLFFRGFDVALYAGGDRTPLYVEREAVKRDSSDRALWTRHARELLGLPETAYPADDYVGAILAWDKSALSAMTEEIRLASGLEWRLALCRRPMLSEYALYGQFIVNAPRFLAEHELVEQSLACAHWEEKQLDEAWTRAMMAFVEPQMVAMRMTASDASAHRKSAAA